MTYWRLSIVTICYCIVILQSSLINSLQSHSRLPAKLTKVYSERKGPADNDFISRFFSKLLPAPEDMGLTRFNSTTRPENYPCIKNEYANLLETDHSDPDKILVRQLLKNTNLETRDLQLIYDGDVDGWTAVNFHKKLDKKGPAVVLGKSVSGGVFGGYNPTGWVNYGEYRGSIAAFLFGKSYTFICFK
mmetsp:Transcript_19157/g.18500  ORF Transcript_19157/g.18500 Transcript_19157/m.18500 type:complete len:189 (+) Transcript_19157:175-741(+)